MASITIRNLDDSVKESLRIRAAQNGHSMEEEARLILKRSVGITGAELLQRSRELFGKKHGFDLELPPRGENDRPPIDFMAPEYGPDDE